MKFRVTYEIVTPEAAAEGDSAEHGFVDRAGECWDTQSVVDGDMFSAFDMSLREALELCSPIEDSGLWWEEIEGSHDASARFANATERRTLHPPRNITKASYRRVTRLLGAR